MKKFEFTLSFTKPEIWVYKVVIEASSLEDAYYRAFYEFADHVARYRIAPEALTIVYKEVK